MCGVEARGQPLSCSSGAVPSFSIVCLSQGAVEKSMEGGRDGQGCIRHSRHV